MLQKICHVGWLLAVPLLAVMLAACATQFQTVELNPTTKRFPTDAKLEAGDVVVRKNLDLREFRKLVYLRTGVAPILYRDPARNRFPQFLKESFEQFHFFDSVKDQQEIQQLIISKGLVDSVVNVSDMLGLNRLSDKIGKFLVVDSKVTRIRDSVWYIFEVKIYNPTDGELVLHIARKALNVSGLDQPLLYPVLNGVKDWIDENS